MPHDGDLANPEGPVHTEPTDAGVDREVAFARGLFESAASPVLLVGADGRVTYANPSAETRFGGVGLVGGSPPSLEAAQAGRWVRSQLGSPERSVDLELWILEQGRRLSGGEGVPGGVPFREIVENVVLGVVVLELMNPNDPGGMVLRYVNPAFTTVLGVDMSQFLGQELRMFSPAAVARGRADQFASVALGAGPRLLDLTYYEAGSAVAGAEEMWIETRVFRVGDGLIGVASENVTRRERAYRGVTAANEALARSNAELDRFASVASHDLQEPLRKVMSFGDRLAMHAGEKLDDRGQDYLKRMRAAASRMRDLINDLLQLSRVTGTSAAATPVALNAILAEVLTDLETTISDTGAVVDIGPLPTVAGNPTLLRQLFQNLIANALKFQPPGQAGRVSIRRQASATPSPQVTIVVEDNGIGIAPEHAKRIFEPFQRLHGRHDYAGTGIGLAICDRIASKHGGTLTVDPEYTGGTRFVLTLALQSAFSPAVAP